MKLVSPQRVGVITLTWNDTDDPTAGDPVAIRPGEDNTGWLASPLAAERLPVIGIVGRVISPTQVEVRTQGTIRIPSAKLRPVGTEPAAGQTLWLSPRGPGLYEIDDDGSGVPEITGSWETQPVGLLRSADRGLLIHIGALVQISA